jgi:hypothetical protein
MSTAHTLNISINLAANATDADVEQAHALIDRIFKRDGISPKEAATVSTTAPVTGVTNIASTTPAATVPAATGELDKEGLPWDERIHSSTKNKNEDGTWRVKRGVDKGMLAKVKASLLSTVAAPAAAATPAPPAAPVQPSLPQMPTPPGLPAVPGANIVNPAYTDFMQFIAQNSPPITTDWLSQVLVAYGIADGQMQSLAHRADLIPAIKAAIAQAIGK